MTLVWKESRDLWPRCTVGLVLLGLAVFAYGELMFGKGFLESVERLLSQHAISVLTGWYPAHVIVLLCLITPWACVLGYDVVAAETAEDTYGFLRTRPMHAAALMAAKLVPRVVLLLVPWLVWRGAVLAYLFWGEPDNWAYDTFTSQQQIDAQYAWFSPPYLFAYAEVLVPIHGLASLSLAVIVGSFTRQRGMALGGGVAASALLGVLMFRLFFDAWYDARVYWEPPVTAVLAVAVVALALLAVACLRIATPSPLARPTAPAVVSSGASGVLWAVLFVGGLVMFTMRGGSASLFGAAPVGASGASFAEALTLLDTGKHAAAERTFRRALKADPDNPVVLFHLALTLERQGKMDEAMPLYERTIAADYLFDDARVHLGDLYAQRGRIDAARRVWNDVLGHKVRAVHTFRNLAHVQKKHGETDAAIQSLRVGLEQFPTDLGLHDALLEPLIDTERYDEAWEHVRAMEAAELPVDDALLDRLREVAPEPAE